MAQNSDALQEPSMDELLASIREIIEENTGSAPQEGAAQSAANAVRPAQNGNNASMQVRNHDTTMPNLKQDIRLRDGGAAPMRPGGGYNNTAQGGYNGGRDPAFSPNAFPGAANVHAAPARGPGNNAGNAGRNGFPAPDSMNALAERIGLHRNNAAAAAENYARPYQPDNNASPLPPFAAAPAHSGPAAQPRPYPPAQAAWPHNSGPMNPNGSPANNGPAMPNNGVMRPRLNPAAGEAEFRHNNAARPGRLPPAEAKAGQAARPAMEPERAGGDRPAGGGHFMAKHIFGADFDKNLPADVEHSTENLLRPFIAQWLDEHFRNLFEKILREEVQRFVQSMRRG